MQKRNNEGASFAATTPMKPGSAKPDPILVADKIMRQFGGLTAVNVDHVEIQRGSITALIGPNGAGKTTFFNLLTGYDAPNSGTWSFNGLPLNGIPPHKVARLGMVRTFQLTKALYRLTVIENMALGARGQKGESVLKSVFPWIWRAQEEEIRNKATAILKNFKLLDKQDDFAAALSGGQRKLLEMARALMVEPEMVMLDEPTFPGCVVSARAVAMLRMTDEKGGDDKLLCVAAGDIRKSGIKDIKDLPVYELEEIKHFFEVYKTLEPGKEVIGGDWVGHDEAEAEIQASYNRYKTTK